jgi:hypothetical protein
VSIEVVARMNKPSNSAIPQLTAGDEFDRHRLLFCDPLKMAQRLWRGRRKLVLRIVQHGQRIAGDRPTARIAPVAGCADASSYEEFRLFRPSGERPGAQPSIFSVSRA